MYGPIKVESIREDVTVHGGQRARLNPLLSRRFGLPHRIMTILAVLLIVACVAVPARGASAGSSTGLLAAETCAARTQVGTVEKVSKGVQVKHGRDWKSARKGTPVYRGDSLRTRKSQKAAVTVCGGGTLYFDSETQARLQSTTEVIAQRGQVAERTARKGVQGIQTRDAKAQGRGAYFEVAAKKGSSVYIVARGSVEVQNQRGVVRVAANHETTVKPGRAPAAPAAIDAQTALRWAAPLAESWSILTAPGVVLAPERLAVDSQGNIYVTDPGPTDTRIVKLSPTGKSLAVWHVATSTNFPSGIELDRQNHLYVTDTINQSILKMSLDGQVLERFDLQRLFPQDPMAPAGIDVDAAGNMYVADRYLEKVLKLSPSGDLLAAWGSSGSAPGQFSSPGDLAVDGQGQVYVADTNNFRIQKLSPTGQVLAVWPLGAVSPPYDVSLDAFGNIYIAASNPERVQELAPDGHTVRIWKNEQSKQLRDPGQFDRPFGVALDAKGNIYVADHYGARIEKLTRG